jgi:peptidoglycan/xylan/chitin deacetylase (PgdA/CDA1 family)
VSGRAATVTNLCFHGIGTPARELEPDEAQYWVSEEQFEELLEVVGRESSLRITFDDGNASDAELALPALKRAGLEASFFVIAGRLDRPGSLSREQVGELARAGMKIGNHGMRHRSWRSLDAAGVQEELVDARAELAEAAGGPIEEAAFPFGEYDRKALRAVRQAGFTRIYTVDGGSARPDAWAQSRHTIVDSDTAATLEALARGEGGRSVRTALKRWR